MRNFIITVRWKKYKFLSHCIRLHIGQKHPGFLYFQEQFSVQAIVL